MEDFSNLAKSSDFPAFEKPTDPVFVCVKAADLPAPHPMEADLFNRHQNIPGHRQEALNNAHITLVGAGGLNSWAGIGLARSGARYLTIIDQDTVDRTNLPRQLFYGPDLGGVKGVRLARNLDQHLMAGGTITGIGLPFEHAIERFAFHSDLLVVGVDNNACRWACASYARHNLIPAVFTMLSRDGMRCHCFLQGPREDDPCLWCAVPDLDPATAAPCAAAIVSACMLAASFTIFFVHRALMGWSAGVKPFNWRTADLMGISEHTIGTVTQRANCPLCSVKRVHTGT